MGELWDGIVGFFENIKQHIWNFQMSFWIGWMQRVKCVEALENVYAVMPDNIKNDKAIKQYYEFRKNELHEAGFDTVGDVAGGLFSSLANDLFKGFKRLIPEMSGDIEKTTKEAIVKGSPAITDAFKDKLGLLVDGILDAIDPGGKKIPEDMRKQIKETMEPVMGLGLTFLVGTALAELIHPTKEMGWGRISHFLYETVGMKELMDAYIDPIRLNLIKMPVKYSINELTTPFIPSFRDAEDWYGRGHIDEDEMKDLMRKHGIDTKWLWRYARMGTKPSSYFMLNAIGREGFWDADDFRFWLSDAGYGAFKITEEKMSPYEKKYGLKPPSTSQIDFLLNAYKHMNIRTTVGDVRAIRRSLLTDGWISREDFEKDLEKYKITKEDAKDALDAIEELQRRKDAKELQKAWEKKYLYGRIDKDELEKKLKELGLREGYVKARLEYLLARREGKLSVEGEEKTLSDARILQAFKQGLKDRGWAIKQIDDKGYTTEDATLIVDEEERELGAEIAREWQRAYETQARKGVISIDELKNKLKELGDKYGTPWSLEEWREARAKYVELMVKKEEEAG